MPSYVVVGASRGIGYQWLKSLSANPSNTVIGTARNAEPVQAQAKADNLPNVHVFSADMTDAASLTSAAAETAKLTNGVVDYLIVNGAYLAYDTMSMKPTDFIGKESLFQDSFTKSMDTNVAGLLYSINAFLELVKKSSIKKVIVISTGHADEKIVRGAGIAEALTYSLSKVALNWLVLKYAVQFKEEGIIFLSIAPGVVLTQAETLDQAPPEIQAMYDGLGQTFGAYMPTYDGPISPKESVDRMLKQIDELTVKDSGAFFGNEKFNSTEYQG